MMSNIDHVHATNFYCESDVAVCTLYLSLWQPPVPLTLTESGCQLPPPVTSRLRSC